MNEALILQTKGSVVTSLPKIGEIRIRLKKQGTGAALSQFSFLPNSKGLTVSLLSGNGFLSTDSAATSGTKSLSLTTASYVFYCKLTADDILCISDITNFTALYGAANNPGTNAPAVDEDISVLKYCTNLTHINIRSTGVYGDISNIRLLTALKYLNISAGVYGNISALSGLTALTSILLQNSKVEGNLYSISGCVSAIEINVSNLYNLTGNLSDLSAMTLLNSLEGDNSNISGDINVLTANIFKIGLATQQSLTYLGTSAVKFPYMHDFYINKSVLTSAQMDNLLISLSKSSWSGNKVLAVKKDIRTSASDSAIATLQANGVTVYFVS